MRRFQHFGRIRLSQPLPIADLMLLALDLEEAKGEWQVRGWKCASAILFSLLFQPHVPPLPVPGFVVPQPSPEVGGSR